MKCYNKKFCDDEGTYQEPGKDGKLYCELCFWMKRMFKDKVIEVANSQSIVKEKLK